MEFDKRYLTEQDRKDINRYNILHQTDNDKILILLNGGGMWDNEDIVELIDVVDEYEPDQELSVEEISKSLVMELGAGFGFVKLSDLDIDILRLILDTGKSKRIPLIYKLIAEYLLQEKRNESIDGLL